MKSNLFFKISVVINLVLLNCHVLLVTKSNDSLENAFLDGNDKAYMSYGDDLPTATIEDPGGLSSSGTFDWEGSTVQGVTTAIVFDGPVFDDPFLSRVPSAHYDQDGIRLLGTDAKTLAGIYERLGDPYRITKDQQRDLQIWDLSRRVGELEEVMEARE